jgi:diguanylate cyclase (GGDEF)-like protein
MRITHEHAQPGVQPIGGIAPGLNATALAECLDGALRGEPELCIDGQQGSAFVHLIEANSSRKLGAVLVVGLRGDDGLSGLLTCSAEYSPDGTIPALQELRAADIQATMRTVGELIASVLNRASAQEALTFSALHDPLTGLANRRLLLERAERMLRTAHRRANGIGLLFLDLDDFKTVNDTLGHDAGDELLCDVATRLRRLATGSTVVARLGGDEFVLLIEAPDPDAAVTRLGSQVMNELSTLFSIRGRQLAVRVSIGASTVAPGKTQNQAASDLVRRADMAMYQAKRRGGSSFELFSEWLEDQVRRKFNLHEELREAIATDQLELWFQPQIKLATNTVIGCEALVRWRHPQKGFILPNDFIGVAEQAGLINDLGDWVFRKATEGLVRLRSAGLADDSFSVAVNVSPLQLIDADLVTRFETMASTAGVSPTQLTIELTESTLAERDRVIPNLTALRAAGFRTSIDDFGTGFSSLSYLRDLPLDEMKIDRSFIQSLGQDRRDLDMVWALVEMGHSLGLSVVAEGVETDTQRVLLDNMGCNIGQGWLFAKAMPVAELTTFIAGWGQVSTSASSLAVS